MDELKLKRTRKAQELHLQQLDIILKDLFNELPEDTELTPEIINDGYQLTLSKWKFLYKHKFIEGAK
jgi:hypothetical protein